MKKVLLTIALLLLPGIALGQGGTPAGGYNVSGSGSGSGSGGQPGAINPLAPASGTAVKMDTKVCQAPDLTITNGQNTVTCARAMFVAADTGKDCFATNHNPSLDTDFPVNIAIMPRGTFTFTSTTTGTCTVATGSSSASVGQFFLGTNDDAGWDNVEALAFAGPLCTPVTVPGGYSMVRKSHFVAQPTTCTNAQTGTFRGMQVTGQGKYSSTFVVEPDYNFASDVNSNMFFSLPGMTVKDLSIIGGGQSNIGSNPAANILNIGVDAQAINVQITGIGGANSNMVGFVGNASGAWDMIIDGAGGTCLDLTNFFFNGLAAFAGNCVGSNSNGRILTCHANCWVAGTGLEQISTVPGFTAAAVLVSGGTLYFDNGFISCANGQAMQALAFLGTATARISNSGLFCNTNGASVAGLSTNHKIFISNSDVLGSPTSVAINLTNSSQFFSGCGNTFGTSTTGPILVASTATASLCASDILSTGTVWYGSGALTCSANCGTSPSISGRNESMVVTLGSATPAASTFTITFAGTWAAAPSCYGSRNTTGTTPVIAGIVTTTTTAVVNLSANMVASEKYSISCGPGI